MKSTTDPIRVAVAVIAAFIVCALTATGSYFLADGVVTWSYPSDRWIEDYQGDISLIADWASGDDNEATYSLKLMQELMDKFGGLRNVGSDALSDSIDWLASRLADDNNTVMAIPITSYPLINWMNASANALLIEPRLKPITITSYALAAKEMSPGVFTGRQFINETAVVVTKNVSEVLENVTSAVIVVLDDGDNAYPSTATYQRYATQLATSDTEQKAMGLLISCSKMGASMEESGFAATSVNGRIPYGCISTADVQLLTRSQDRGEQPTMQLQFDGDGSQVDSKSLQFELEGSSEQMRREVVLLTAFVDSWQVANSDGYVDDAAGVAVVVNAMRILKQRGTNFPGRTGSTGAVDYAKEPTSNKTADTVVFALESRRGQFMPVKKEISTVVYRYRQEETNLLKDIAGKLPEGLRVQLTATETEVGPGATEFFEHSVAGLTYELRGKGDDTVSGLKYAEQFTSDDLLYTSKLYAIFAYLLANS